MQSEEQSALIEEAQRNFEALINEFITLANNCKDKGIPPTQISAALMSAAATYTTFVYAGNEGYLQQSGLDKVVESFRSHLEYIQNYKKSRALKNNSMIVEAH